MSNMVVATNVLALNAHRNLKTVGAKQAKAESRLASGYRVNSAADDAAGLAISEKMRAQVRGLNQASTNAQDGMSLIQTAEGGMQEIDNMLQRVRELTVQASNDSEEHNTKGTGDRQKVQDEINQLVEEIDSMASRVEFNKKKVIDGTYAKRVPTAEAKSAIVTAGTTDAAIKAAADLILAAAEGTTGNPADGSGAAVLAEGGLTGTASSLRAAQDAMSRMDSTHSNYGSMKDAVIEAERAYETARAALGADTAPGTHIASAAGGVKGGGSEFLTSAVAQDVIGANTSGIPLYFQVGANAGQGVSINIESVTTDKLGIGDGQGHSTIDVRKASGDDINSQLDRLDTALSYVTTERSKLGAAQNRMEYTMKSLDISSENLAAAESRIRDADMAKEMMNLTQANVMQQAATSMLSQANQAPQSVLQLLQ